MKPNKKVLSSMALMSFLSLMPMHRAEAATNPILGNLEYPAVNQSIESDFLDVSGWAIGMQGVSAIKVYVDGAFVGDAVYGFERKDVNSAFPSYKNSVNSAFTFKLQLSKLNDGKHNVKVDIIGLDGTKGYLTSNFSTKKLEKLQPRMWIETPDNGVKTNGDKLRFIGWALNESGVKEVKVYVDDKYVSNTTYGFERKDVDRIYYGYKNGVNSGFIADLDTSLLRNGMHKVTFEAVGIDGSTQKIDRQVNSIIPEPIFNLDTPTANVQVNGSIDISGWALNSSGINNVSVAIDDKIVGNATYGLSRADVPVVYPGYRNGEKSGFSYNYDAAYLTLGKHKVTVTVNGKDGTVQSSVATVNVSRKQPMIHLDSLSNGTTINKDSFDIVGWTISDSLTKNVAVYLDDVQVGEAFTGFSRPDVQDAFKDYRTNLKSGFSYKLDTSKLPIGKHTILVQANSVDGTKVEEKFTINMAGVVYYKSYSNTLDYYTNIQASQNSQISYDYSTSSWRTANRDEIFDSMNPKKYVNDSVGKYMFLKLTYFEGVTEAQLNTLLKGKGILEGRGAAFLAAGKSANVNPIYLVSHALLETGNGKSSLATGKLIVDKLYDKENYVDENGNATYRPKVASDVTPKAIYNMYGIGAYDADANLWGADKAYREGWFDPDAAIIGGAKWIAASYIGKGQDTLYKMKWDFSTSSMWHQYATDVQWAYKQTSRIKALVDMLDKPVLVFEVPNFKE
jgi:beta-N-acetylglucosaminidase